MLFLALFLTVSSQNWFIGGGTSVGVGFTDTEVRRSILLGAQLYPLSYRKPGLFYDFQFSHPDSLATKPFLVERGLRSHSFGPVFRFSLNRVQPWLGGGVLFYSENTKIKLFNELIADSMDRKTVPVIVAGSRFIIWKKVYGEAGFNLTGTARPPWQFFF